MAINTITIALFYGLLFICAGKCVCVCVCVCIVCIMFACLCFKLCGVKNLLLAFLLCRDILTVFLAAIRGLAAGFFMSVYLYTPEVAHVMQ